MGPPNHSLYTQERPDTRTTPKGRNPPWTFQRSGSGIHSKRIPSRRFHRQYHHNIDILQTITLKSSERGNEGHTRCIPTKIIKGFTEQRRHPIYVKLKV